MVQTESQYEFIYEYVLLWLKEKGYIPDEEYNGKGEWIAFIFEPNFDYFMKLYSEKCTRFTIFIKTIIP